MKVARSAAPASLCKMASALQSSRFKSAIILAAPGQVHITQILLQPIMTAFRFANSGAWRPDSQISAGQAKVSGQKKVDLPLSFVRGV